MIRKYPRNLVNVEPRCLDRSATDTPEQETLLPPSGQDNALTSKGAPLQFGTRSSRTNLNNHLSGESRQNGSPFCLLEV